MYIIYILPNVNLDQVVGGYRVHYEYANRLAARGHLVEIIHLIDAPDLNVSEAINSEMSFNGQILATLNKKIKWFQFQSSIAVTQIVAGQALPASDVVICTAWQTAEIYGKRRSGCGVTVQIAYDYEFWMKADANLKERMCTAFGQTDVMISGSDAVTQMLTECGRKVDATITCGINRDIFRVIQPIQGRKPVIGILLREQKCKRVDDAIEAIAMVRSQHDIAVMAAGRWGRSLPDWIVPAPSATDAQLNAFYNQLSVFVLPSEYEGWGLPAMEAMAAGACVISARNGGVESFLEHEEQGLLYEPKNVAQLSLAISHLLDNDGLRVRLASQAQASLQDYSWDRSVDALESLLRSKLPIDKSFITYAEIS